MRYASWKEKRKKIYFYNHLVAKTLPFMDPFEKAFHGFSGSQVASVCILDEPKFIQRSDAFK